MSSLSLEQILLYWRLLPTAAVINVRFKRFYLQNSQSIRRASYTSRNVERRTGDKEAISLVLLADLGKAFEIEEFSCKPNGQTA